MGDRPIVTVCIPTFNRGNFLQTSLPSVLNQSLRDIEVIVSDNGSTDNTPDIVGRIRDSRLRYDRLDTNIGLFGNMSRCLRLGHGAYRVVLPDDDLMLPENLARKVAFMQAHPAASFVHSGFYFVGDDSGLIGPPQNWSRLSEAKAEPGQSFILRSIAIGGIVCVSSVLLRSDMVTDEVFDGNDGPYADLALWLRLASRGEVGFLPEPLSGLRIHVGSASSSFEVVRVRRGHTLLTRHHADAILQSHGRFVEYTKLDPQTRAELAKLLKATDRRLRLKIAVHELLPASVLQRLKAIAGWRPGGKLYHFLSMDGAYMPPTLEENTHEPPETS